MLTAGSDGRIKVWKMTGSVPAPEGHVLTTDQQGYMAFSPDGKLLAVGSYEGQYQVFDTATFAVVSTLTGHANTDNINGVGFTADGTHLYAVDDGDVLTDHVVGGSLAPDRTITVSGAGWALGLSPKSTATTQWLGVGYDDGTGDIANVQGSTITPTPITVTSDGSGVYSLTFSPDGTEMAAGGDDGVASFWSIPPTDGTPDSPAITILDSQGDTEGINTIRYSPDGNYIAIAAGDETSDWSIGIYDAVTRLPHSSSTAVPADVPYSLAWSPSQGIIVAGEASCGKLIVCADQ